MDCKNLHFSRHAFERMFQRGIDPIALAQIVASGEVIAAYPEDKPYPSFLLLGFHAEQPVHAVVAHDPVTGNCYAVTIYRPDPELWDETSKNRRAR